MKVDRRQFLVSAMAMAYSANALPSVFTPMIFSSVNDGESTPGNKDIRISDRARLHAVVRARDESGNLAYFSDAQRGNVRKWEGRRLEPRWLEARAEKSSYDNTAGERIRYEYAPVGEGWTHDPESRLGTRRYFLSMNSDETQKTLGGSSKNINNAHRISTREADDLAGWMTAWFGLPYIWGSSSKQVESFEGADCADLITGAAHKMGHKEVPYTWSLAFRPYGDLIFRGRMSLGAGFTDMSGKPANIDVKRGDLIAFKDPARHVAVFYNDANLGRGSEANIIHTYATGGDIANLSNHSMMMQLSAIYHGVKDLSPKRVFSPTLSYVEVIRLRGF